MVYILSKLLIFLIKPIVWLCALLLWSIVTKNKLHRKRLLVTSLVMLYVCSNGFVVGSLYNAYEEAYPSMRKFEVGIVLGGFASENKRNHQIEFNWANDRLMQSVKLLKTGKVERLLISGGNAFLLNNKVKEADLALSYLNTIGIPDSLILTENQSRNTVENARFAKRLLDSLHVDAKQVLVISSAWHLPRVKVIFDKQFGSGLTYYPTNFLGKPDFTFDDYVIPNPEAFNNFHFLIKEWVGLLIDRVRS